MCKKLIYFVLLLAFCLASSLQAGSIIWVDEAAPDGFTGWQALLEGAGHTVTLRSDMQTLDAANIASLNEADLVIVSRDTNSGSYDDGDEVTQWNSLTVPLIQTSSYLVRSSRWQWIDGTGTPGIAAGDKMVIVEDHFIFTGVGSAGDQIAMGTSEVDISDATNGGNGQVLGTHTDGRLWIVLWEDPVTPFYAGTTQLPAAPRMWFGAGLGVNGADKGGMNLTDEGQTIFLNAVLYMLGEVLDPGCASDPSPVNESTDVLRDVVLSWTPGIYAAPTNGHKVYLSENFNDVNDGIGGIAQDANTYTPDPRLDFGTTYYWRVDEVNAPPTSHIEFKGEVWSFTTELLAYPIQNIIATASSSDAVKGPENTVNGSGLDDSGLLHGRDADDNMWMSSITGPQPTWIEFQFDRVYKLHEMWVWNSNQSLESVLGLGIKDASIEYSVDGTDYTTLGTTHEFARAPGMPDYAHNTTVDFDGAAAKYVRLTVNSNWGGLLNQYGLSEVRFFHIPVNATEPYPDSGAAGVDVDVTLGFRAGREAATHDVYLSTDEQAVIDGTAAVTTVTEASYGPLSLDLDMTYYWKINEVNEAETPTTWESDLWSFTTREFLIVDDFEAYNDLNPEDPASNRIFLAWLDGFGVATNGSLVGYDVAPFAEQTIVHSGEQSMPLSYNNTGTAVYSEAVLTLSPSQDWTKAGVATLVLYFHGTTGSTGQLYVKINDSKVVYDGDAADIATLRWKQWNIDLASVGANLQSVTKLSIGIDGSGATGKLYFDDFRLYRLAPEVVVPSEEIWIEAESAATITAPLQIYDDPAASGGKYIGTDDGIGNQSDNPPPDGIATYNFTVAGGTYKISGRINIPGGSNSFWVQIQGATTPAETELHSSGWVRWNDPPDAASWFWNDVFSDDDDQDATVLFTMPAGAYTLEIARREDGAMLDVIVISKID